MRAGHPWVFGDPLLRVEVGEVVELTDERDRVVAWGLGDEGAIAIRVLGREPAPPEGVAGWLRERVRRADQLRLRLIPADTTSYRVVNGEGDGLSGVVVDRYGDLAVMRLYSAAWETHLDHLVDAVARLPWVATVVRKLGVNRVDGSSGGVTLRGPPAPERVVVSEGGMTLLARPLIGQKTGMFLDQREHRALVGRVAAGRRVANLFGYTGGFSVAAALGGAATVVTVDLAEEALDDARENFRLNGLDPTRYTFERADAFGWTPGSPVDLLVLDPPALSRDQSSDAAARRAYAKLHRHHGGGISREGLLATSSCSARLSWDAWAEAVRDGLSGVAAGTTGSPTPADWSWLWRSGNAFDHPVALGHPEGHYLKFALLARR